MKGAAVMLVVLGSAAAWAADFQWHARLWAGPGYDSNAKREFVSARVGTANDVFAFGLAQLDAQVQLGERVRLLGAYDVAGRKFLLNGTEDTVVQSAQLEGTVAFLNLFQVGLSGRARDRRGADRDYTDLQGGVVLDFLPSAQVDVRASLAAHRFIYWNRFGYSFWGPDGTLTARYRFDRRHSISVFGNVNPRSYNANRFLPANDDESAPPAQPRQDSVFGAGVSYSYRGPFHFTLSYSYFDQASNSYGESVQRHRVSATGGVRLPWQLTVLASVTWQPSIFPDGVFLNPELSIVEEDENVSSATLKVVRPLNRFLDLDLRYAGYLGFYPSNEFIYLRHVVTVGLSFSL